MSLAESVFLSKQNMLAQMSLSPQELNAAGRNQQWSETLCDIEDEDIYGDREKSRRKSSSSNCGMKNPVITVRNPSLGCEQSKLDLATVRKLKSCILGPHGHWSDGWHQSFYFNSNISYGLVQEKVGF